MKDEEILKKAIEKAKSNGWTNPHMASDYWGIIFSHDFAKAFFGNNKIEIGQKEEVTGHIMAIIPIFMRAWQYHLQKMVLEENPIKYLEKIIS